MSDTKFTPGPWLVGEDQCVDETWSIVTTSGGSIIANVNDRHDRKANAHLISAAPDLFAALDLFVHEYVELVNSGDAGNWGPEEVHKVIVARAALARARGEA